MGLFRVASLVGLLFQGIGLAFGCLADRVGVVLGGVGLGLVGLLGGLDRVLGLVAEAVGGIFGGVGSGLTFLADLFGFLLQRLGVLFKRFLAGVLPLGIARSQGESAGGSGEKAGNGRFFPGLSVRLVPGRASLFMQLRCLHIFRGL